MMSDNVLLNSCSLRSSSNNFFVIRLIGDVVDVFVSDFAVVVHDEKGALGNSDLLLVSAEVRAAPSFVCRLYPGGKLFRVRAQAARRVIVHDA